MEVQEISIFKRFLQRRLFSVSYSELMYCINTVLY